MHLFDMVFGFAARGPRFFCDGWGDRALCDTIDPELLMRRRVKPIVVRLGPAERALGGLLREGAFESPEDRLPFEARTARVKLLLPQGDVRGVVVHLAASGDEGFWMRLRFAAPLLGRGIGALVLENSFYGSRRRTGQGGYAVRSVSDLALMGAATFQEGRALLRWLRDEGYERVGVTGFSMGGQLAAMVGASMPFPVAVVPIAASCSPDSVVRDGVLRRVFDWSKLAVDGAAEAAVREELYEQLARFSVTSLPAPEFPPAAIVVGTADDGVVPPEDMRRIAEYWGCELRWLPAGHVTAVLRHQGAMRDAIADAFDRLAAAPARTPRRRRAKRDQVRKLWSLAAPAAIADGARARRVQRSAGNRR